MVWEARSANRRSVFYVCMLIAIAVGIKGEMVVRAEREMRPVIREDNAYGIMLPHMRAAEAAAQEPRNPGGCPAPPASGN